MGRYTVEGTFTVPYDATSGGYASGMTWLNDWITSTYPTSRLMEFYWGGQTGATAGHLYFLSSIVPNGKPTLSGDDEKMLEIPFRGLNNSTTGYPPIRFILADGVDTVAD